MTRNVPLRVLVAAAVIAAILVSTIALLTRVLGGHVNHDTDAYRFWATWVAIALGALILGCIAFGVVLRHRIHVITSAARALAAGDMSARAAVGGRGDMRDLASTFNDMTDRLSQTVRDLNESQTLQQRFVSDVSHELRTPLAAILAAGEALDSADPAVRTQAGELVRTQTRRMNRLVEDLLEMSRFDAGQATFVPEQVELTDVVHDVVHAVAPDAQIRVTAFGDLVVDVDVRRVHTILRNLIRNAVQHGQPPIDVVVDARTDPITVTVADDGDGVPADIVPTVFDRFVRGNASRNTATGSTGLGLAIAAENAQIHGGSITVSTGGRTAFSVHLPRRHAAGSATD